MKSFAVVAIFAIVLAVFAAADDDLLPGLGATLDGLLEGGTDVTVEDLVTSAGLNVSELSQPQMDDLSGLLDELLAALAGEDGARSVQEVIDALGQELTQLGGQL